MTSIPARRILTSCALRPCMRSSAVVPNVRAATATTTGSASSSLRATFSSKSHGAATITVARRTAQPWNPRQWQTSTPVRNAVRWSTTSATGSKIWTFEEIKSLTTTPSPKPTLIDVREPSELSSTGRIPGALNIPITTSPDSFHIAPEEFEDRFGFARPEKDDEVVFYCKAGVRSRAAAGIAREAGWKDVGEFPGSWVEWTGKGGDVER
ncbi:Rhodanese-like domain-containing protein [Xylaria sp. FL0064]|nr:Rhodanese-like domain-containing protein [Xylaria sp. FL0064]